MKKTDSEALKWAIKKYWREKSDESLASGLGMDVADVKSMREQMGYKRESLKDFTRRYLLDMPEKEKMEFVKRLPADLVWRMAEGSPATSGELTLNNEPIRIDITHQLLKIYGPEARTVLGGVSGDSKDLRLPSGSGE